MTAYSDTIKATSDIVLSHRPNSKDDLLAFQQEVDGLKKTLIALEADLRKKVVETFATPEPGKTGVENVDLGWGHTLKVTHAITYKLDNANDCEKLDKVLDAIEKSMAGGDIIAGRLVKWKPELSVSEYKLLSPENKKLVDGVLTVTDSMPSIALVKKGA